MCAVMDVRDDMVLGLVRLCWYLMSIALIDREALP